MWNWKEQKKKKDAKRKWENGKVRAYLYTTTKGYNIYIPNVHYIYT